MLPNLDLERRIQAIERFMREIRGDRGATEPATWTPTWTGLTVVGSPTYVGTYTRIGRLVFWQVVITAGGANTTASTLTTTFINNLPFISRLTFPNVRVINNNTGVDLGNGYIVIATNDAYTPTWAATNADIIISGWYEI